MSPTSTLVVIGASLAGAKAAEGARDAGFDGRILLVGDEPGPPYERPPLSKAVLRGEKPPESTAVHPEGFYVDHDIELVEDRAVSLDLSTRRVELARRGSIRFDSAVLATGAAPRRLQVPGSDLAGLHHLRTLADAVALHDALGSATRVAVVGAGWIGSEVAASAREMGVEVVLVDPAPVPLQRVLGDRIGGVFGRLHAEHGVDLLLGTGVAELRGSGRIEAIVLDDGRTAEVDLVVAGIGVVPRTDLAETAGLPVEDGIVVDAFLESAAAGVFAAGDVASAWHPHYDRHLRIEHWSNALHQGDRAGRNAVGDRAAYSRLPYFFSDQYDLGMEYVGRGGAGDEVTVRGDVEAREFIAFWHRDREVTAAMNVNVWDVVDDLTAIVGARKRIDPSLLADEDVPLGELARDTATSA